jgi:hypothetical protein
MRLNATRLGSIASSRSFGDQLDDLAGQVPSLDLNFARNKSLIDDYSGTTLVTHTRASSGTFVGSNGVLQTAATDVPRFDHNPQTGESLGLLVEEQRTNLTVGSELFTGGGWTPGAISVASTTVTTAPDGSNNASKLTENTVASQFHFLNYAITKAASAITYTYSIYLKAAGREVAFSIASGSNGVACRFDVATGVITGNAGTFGTGFTAAIAAITAASNGWYRCSLTCTTDTTVSLTAQISLWNTSLATNVYTGDGVSGVYAWGAQLEAGAFPTSYIPTTSATVTRAADVASITGTNFSRWYNQTEGTVFSDATVSYTVPGSAFPLVVGLNDGTANNKIVNGYLTSAGAGFEVSTGGVGQAGIYPSTASTNRKLASCYRLNDFAASVNGGTVGTDTSGTVPTVDRLGINVVTGYNALNGTIKRLTYWPTRLGNEVLQRITQP